jgi:hypothetical protein
MSNTNEYLPAIFDTIKTALENCCPPMVVNKSSKDNFEIIGNKAVPYGSKKEIVSGMYFASVVARKDKITFYFFCNYTHPQEFKTLAPTLMKCLKGKSCFHFKKAEEVNVTELTALLETGMKIFKQEGYLL